jgi:transglutaminase-like putative cysteine protease
MRLGSLGTQPASGTAVHSVLGAGRYRVTELGDSPDEQVARTMRRMGELASQDAANPIFREFAARTFAGIDPADKQAVIDRAFERVRNAISFQRDEVSGAGLGGLDTSDLIEFIVRPVDMARYIDEGVAIGDCDDYSMLCSALLATQGIPTKFCTVAADDRAPDQFSHVYCVAYLDGERIPLDTSHGDYAGWEVDQTQPVSRKQEWSADGGCSLVTLAIVGAAAYFGYKALEAV